MPGMIAWETHSGEDVERAIATYICLLNPRASRIRPSVGDGGMDVLVTNEDGTRIVYQVKKYAANLKAGQKREIEKSFQNMLSYTNAAGYQIREWHLVMPLDPTKEGMAWFEGFTGGCGIDCLWDGRARIDGWAASMPQVGDYYFNGGSEYVRMKVNEALSAARLADSTNWLRIKESISDQQQLLDSRDPHYSYSFHSYSAFEVEEPPFIIRPGVVLSTAEGRDGVGWVVMDVIAKHSASTELAPLTGTLTVEPKTKEEAEALRAFFDYGVPLPEMAGRVTDKFVTGIEDGGPKNCDGTLRTFHSPGLEWSGPESIMLRSRRGNQLELLRCESSAGNRGEHWEGRDRSGLIVLQYYLDYDPWLFRFGLALTNVPTEGARVDDALESIRCLREAVEDDAILFVGRENGVFETGFSKLGLSMSDLNCLYMLFTAASHFNRYSYRPIGLSALLELTSQDLERMAGINEFCNGRPVCYRYERWNCSFFNEVPDDGVALVLCVSPLTVMLRGEEYKLGQCLELFVGEPRTIDEGESTDFSPTSAYGDAVIRLYPKSQPTLRTANHIVVCDPPTEAEWKHAIEEIKESHSLTGWLKGACEDLLGKLEERCA